MAEKTKQNKIDMLNGNIGTKLILFACPLAATGILQQLFNAADVAVVGRFVDKYAMAAVGSNAPVVGLMVNLFTGIALGANVIISRMIGAGEKTGIKKAVHTSIVVALVAGLIMTLVGELAAHPLLSAMGVPDNIMPMALAYLRIYMLGFPVIFLYNFESAIFRSKGDTLTPLLCLVISGILNVILNLFFVIICHMSASGVALATVISNFVSSLMMFVMLLKRHDDIAVRIKDLKISFPVLKDMLKIGVPAGVQGCVFSISNICVQSAVNSLGADIIAASAAAFNIEIIAYYLINSFGQACTTFVSQNRGAGKYDRCKQILKTSLLQSFAASALCAAVLLLPGKYILSIFNTDPEVISFGIIRLYAIVGFEAINAVIEIFSGALRGHALSLGPAVMALVGICGTRICWVMSVFTYHHTFTWLMAVYPVSWIVTSIMLIIYYIAKRRVLYEERGGVSG